MDAELAVRTRLALTIEHERGEITAGDVETALDVLAKMRGLFGQVAIQAIVLSESTHDEVTEIVRPGAIHATPDGLRAPFPTGSRCERS